MNNKKYILGIDPGTKGSITVLNIYTLQISIIDFRQHNYTVVHKFLDSIKEKIIVAYIENVLGFIVIKPKEGSDKPAFGANTFKLGKEVGIINFIVTEMCKINTVLVTAQVWQKKVLGQTNKGNKQLCVEKARQLFAASKLKFDKENSDSVLLAYYGYLTYTKG